LCATNLVIDKYALYQYNKSVPFISERMEKMNRYTMWSVYDVDKINKVCTLRSGDRKVELPFDFFDKIPEYTDTLYIKILNDEEYDEKMKKSFEEDDKLFELYDEVYRLYDKIDELENELDD